MVLTEHRPSSSNLSAGEVYMLDAILRAANIPLCAFVSEIERDLGQRNFAQA